jgi:hypothetical protein
MGARILRGRPSQPAKAREKNGTPERAAGCIAQDVNNARLGSPRLRGGRPYRRITYDLSGLDFEAYLLKVDRSHLTLTALPIRDEMKATLYVNGNAPFSIASAPWVF